MTTTTGHPVANETRTRPKDTRLPPANGVEGRRPPANPPVDRLGAMWQGRWWILLSALVIAALTLVATMVVPKTFASSVTVRMNASPVSGSSVSDLATASNNLAAQYAQVVTSQAVLQPAAAAAGITPAELSAHTSSTTLASQNIISITVQAGGPAEAQAQADALGASLVDYIKATGAEASKAYSDSVEEQLAPLDDQISAAQKRVAAIAATLANADDGTAPQEVSAASARLGAAQSLLTALSDRRSNLLSQATVQALSLAPRAQVLGPAATANQIEPRPALYTLVAALLGLVIATQLVVTVAERRQRRLAEPRG